MASTNTLRRPGKPVTTFLGPVLYAQDQQGFYLYQPSTNLNHMLWFAQPTKADATVLRNKMGKQPKTYKVAEQELLEAIKQAVHDGANGLLDPDQDPQISAQDDDLDIQV